MRNQNAAAVGLNHMSQREVKKIVGKKSPSNSPGKDALANLRQKNKRLLDMNDPNGSLRESYIEKQNTEPPSPNEKISQMFKNPNNGNALLQKVLDLDQK